MKRVMPIVVYRNGIRYVVAEATVDIEDDVENLHLLEIDITEPQLSMIRNGITGDSYSLPREK